MDNYDYGFNHKPNKNRKRGRRGLVGIAVVIVTLAGGAAIGGCGSNTESTVTSVPAATAASSTTTVAPTTTTPDLDVVSTPTIPEMVVQVGDTIKVDYTGKLDDGTVFDSSIDRGEPLEFVVGSGSVITGFDEGVIGLAEGESATLVIPPEEGYGAQSDDNVVELAATPEDMEGLSVGDTVYVNDGTMAVTVVAINDASIVVDANHPLAGKTLTFDIEIVDISRP